MQQIALSPVPSVTITILLDNVFDGLLSNQGVAKRPGLSPQKIRLPVATMEGGMTGIQEIYAIIGGFHLSGAAFAPLIDQTCELLAAFAPQVIVPTHCTGFAAIHQLATRLPNAFIQSSVGTRFEL